jgi:predicted secreted hydrolase
MSLFDCQTQQRICWEKLYLPSPWNVKMSEYVTQVGFGESRIRLTDRNELTVKCDFEGGQISFVSEPAKPNLRIGGGAIPLGARGELAKFYSLADLHAIGKLRIGGKERDVTSSIWFDHEWGSWSWDELEEWIWARIEIDPDRMLLVYVVKSHSRPEWKRLVLLSEGGVEEREDFHYEVLRKWRSPATGDEYPVSVVVSDCGDVAGFRLEAMSDDQEFLSELSRFKGYWEGCCNVYRDGDKVGQANLEVVRS